MSKPEPRCDVDDWNPELVPHFSTYLFDLDGTLIDSIGLIMASYRHTMQRHLGAVPAERDWRAGFGTPLRTQLAKFGRDPDEVEAMTATYRAYNNEHHDQMVTAYPGVHDLLESLHVAGVPLAVVTSKNRASMERGLRLCGLDHFFEEHVTTDDVTRFKPHPEPVIEALARLRAEASGTVFVGDSPHDVAAGRAAGVQTAAALWGPFDTSAFEESGHKPDFWLHHPAELHRVGS